METRSTRITTAICEPAHAGRQIAVVILVDLVSIFGADLRLVPAQPVAPMPGGLHVIEPARPHLEDFPPGIDRRDDLFQPWSDAAGENLIGHPAQVLPVLPVARK